MKSAIRITFAVVITWMLLSEIEMQDLAQLDSGPIEILKYVIAGIKDDIQEVFNPPSNRKDSIQYLLFTPENPKNVQYIEPTQEFDQAPFNPNYETKVMIHGYETRLKPGNIFEKIKDEMLATGRYNVIIVNWILYAIPPYPLGIANTLLVGNKVSEMIQFIMNRTGIPASRFHLIGHSLGAHLVGIVGKRIPNIGRITGLDPAGPLYEIPQRFNRLYYTDAEYVDVIHTSNHLTGKGLGLYQSIGWRDFYPNGGNYQPHCQRGGNFIRPDGTNLKLETFLDLALCNHEISLQYFLYSIQNCTFLSTECESYSDLEKCTAESKSTDRMGYYSMKSPNLPPKSDFYLNTTATAPYC
ncbi:inactive pancreatic lipase-related protein 1 [Nephila pilipes]|uniref:Inactive pancreatic lipase-related protein 1 n=1 Tax=Nephila pilipes TaxID=299642 RepID=A0A8X6KJZ4_NEPPI|nr:inactive pancreatic lipase-related protein 1 [Nephila pilipes]